MSVRIRLKRFGTNKRPYYRIVVMDSRTKRDGKALEVVGLYHPIETEEKQVRLETERIQAWLQQGAIPSPTVKRILNKHKIFLT
ncbi:MAG: 30S ribosomal protein S16 [Spirochaetes bacterium]|nr:30S ribosomal protein S16 [Spirochaetota bacterium]